MDKFKEFNISNNENTYLETLKILYSDERIENRAKFYQLYNLLKEIISKSISYEKQIINSDFAKIEFIINKYRLNPELSNALHSIRNYAKKSHQSVNVNISQNIINVISKTIIELFIIINVDYQDEFINRILDIETIAIPYQKKALIGDYFDLYSATVIDKYYKQIDEINFDYYIVLLYEEEQYSLLLNNEWEDIYKYVDLGTEININFVSIKKIENDNDYKLEILLNRKSIIVLAPDFLFDVTDIASSIDSPNYSLFFFNLILRKKANIAILKGNLVNYIFDELVIDNNANYEELYEKGIKQSPISLFALSKTNPEDIKMLKYDLKAYYENIKYFLKNYQDSEFTIEPSFISPKWGMQGRIDLLIEANKDENLKDIIELKSGKFPNINMSLGQGKHSFKAGMWASHYAQISCYNMILSSVYKNRKGNSSIFYASTKYDANRNAAINEQYNKSIIKLRNKLVYELVNFAVNDNAIIDNFFIDLNGLPKFKVNEVNEFADLYFSASNLEKKYFNQLLKFILKELLANVLFDSNKSKISDLWKLSIEEKKEKSLVIDNLSLNYEKSEFTKLHLFFDREKVSNYFDSFRNGDIIILYQITNNFTSPINDIILKGVIKEIDNNKVIISLRNKTYPIKYFYKNKGNWTIELDQSDSNTKRLIPNLFELLYINNEKKRILLGVDPPRIKSNKIEVNYEALTDNQNFVLNEILNSEDYYLLQGPPGTGKTSYVIKYIVKYLIENTNENILLIAYTNRALDEICEVVNKLGFDYLRLGNKESSIHQNNLLCNIIENNDIRTLFKEINKYKIVASTVFSAVNTNDIFNIWDFSTIIVDEASQILEPQIIGTLCKAKRFILIGDEKQLPAISSQPEVLIEDNELIKVGIENISNSVFERMLRNVINNGWDYARGSLNIQARMHKEIQHFSNIHFYNSQLNILDLEKRQSKDFNLFSNANFEDELIMQIAKNRFVFINSNLENTFKYNSNEAEICAKIINSYTDFLGNNFNEKTIGIISPFRAQCALIAKFLEQTISTNLLSKISIDTVERYQGSERDIIIYSFATNYYNLIEKMSSRTFLFNQEIDRKLNVALTRAKEQIIILGNEEILSLDKIYKNLIAHSKSVDSYFIG